MGELGINGRKLLIILPDTLLQTSLHLPYPLLTLHYGPYLGITDTIFPLYLLYLPLARLLTDDLIIPPNDLRVLFRLLSKLHQHPLELLYPRHDLLLQHHQVPPRG